MGAAAFAVGATHGWRRSCRRPRASPARGAGLATAALGVLKPCTTSQRARACLRAEGGPAGRRVGGVRLSATAGTVTAPPMDGVTAPAAVPPSAPQRPDEMHLSGSPDFTLYHSRMAGAQEEIRRMQDVTTSGRQMAYLALARLQRADSAGAAAILAELESLPPPAETAGASWDDVRRRLELCSASGHGNFVEMYVATLGFHSFLDRGVLTPTLPPGWQTGIQDYDDELYLLGVIAASREIERYAINRGQQLDLKSINLCLGTVQSLEQALMQFNLRNSDLRQRFDGIKYVVKRLESLAYEVSLALQRAAIASSGAHAGEVVLEAASVEAGDEGLPAPDQVIDLQLIGAMKERYDTFDAQRELTMKQSRDVIKAAKNAIYALQRADFKRADSYLAECTRDANAIYESIVSNYPRLRDGLFTGSLEEFAEALAYRAFRQDKAVLSLEEMQSASGLSFDLTLLEYLGGLMDLTGEVNRMAIRAAGRGRAGRKTVMQCLACVDAVYNGAQALPPSRLGKKFGALKQTLTKIEVALYELSLLSQGVRSSVAEGENA